MKAANFNVEEYIDHMKQGKLSEFSTEKKDALFLKLFMDAKSRVKLLLMRHNENVAMKRYELIISEQKSISDQDSGQTSADNLAFYNSLKPIEKMLLLVTAKDEFVTSLGGDFKRQSELMKKELESRFKPADDERLDENEGGDDDDEDLQEYEDEIVGKKKDVNVDEDDEWEDDNEEIAPEGANFAIGEEMINEDEEGDNEEDFEDLEGGEDEEGQDNPIEVLSQGNMVNEEDENGDGEELVAEQNVDDEASIASIEDEDQGEEQPEDEEQFLEYDTLFELDFESAKGSSTLR